VDLWWWLDEPALDKKRLLSFDTNYFFVLEEMLDCLTIFNKGGLILFHFSECQTDATKGQRHVSLLNDWIATFLLHPTQEKSVTNKSITLDQVAVEWEEKSDWIAVAFYAEVLRSRQSGWVRTLLQLSLLEYSLLQAALQQRESPAMNEFSETASELFLKTFQVLLRQCKEGTNATAAASSRIVQPTRSDVAKAAASKKSGKEKRYWRGDDAKVTKEAMAELDFSKEAGDYVNGIDAVVADDSRALAEARAAYLPDPKDLPEWEQNDVILDQTDGDSEESSSWGSSLRGLLDQMTGNKVLTARDLESPLQQMEKMLTAKNVATDIAKDICHMVQVKLAGKRLRSFAQVKTAVRQALEEAIAKILRPRNIDIDVAQAVISKRESQVSPFWFGTNSSSTGKKSGSPYVIVMIGINGVGKSTSLAKIAYYLKCKGCNPLIAACDTFRSGAVEQLNVHAKCLGVPLYHRGYAKDPSTVAKAAIAHAAAEGHDVVLVDTAGRMQNNVPLMKALSKLVVTNSPDFVLFVGEALVGHDGMDQLRMFNQALKSGGHGRNIDGIVLTKFDTVSDKVGAALTLTHVTGAPIVFVGTGQKYNHLKKLSVPAVIQSLFR
jgi:signal recognition particle receptor subunit alpha